MEEEKKGRKILSFTPEFEIYEKIKKISILQKRSTSNVIDLIVLSYFENKDYLNPKV